VATSGFQSFFTPFLASNCQTREHKKANKAKLLQWLSQLVNNGKIIAILGEWLGYSPGAEGADAVLAEMASLTGLDIERTHQIWQTQNELWQQIFAESEANLMEILQRWLECTVESKEESYQGCLELLQGE